MVVRCSSDFSFMFLLNSWRILFGRGKFSVWVLLVFCFRLFRVLWIKVGNVWVRFVVLLVNMFGVWVLVGGSGDSWVNRCNRLVFRFWLR